MGPAGFTLAHHLVNDGHTVVAVDGLKIEPLDPSLSGITIAGERVPFQPIRDVATLIEPLDDRVMAGFGGVAEYGITVRWDKNFLKMIRLLLERRDRFALYGGVRFGGTLDEAGALRDGFRPCRAGHRRGQADGARPAQWTGQRRAHRIRFPDGAAADRRGQARLHRQHAVAPARDRRGRRPDGDRHGHRVARVLPGAGGEIPGAARSAGGGERGCCGRGRMDAARPRHCGGIPRTCAGDPRRARRRATRGPRAAHRRAGAAVGRRDRGVSPPPDRQPVVHAQPRGNRKGAGGGHSLRRGPDTAIHRRRCGRRGHRACKVSVQHNDGDGVWHETAHAVLARAHDPDRRRHAAQHGAGARGCRALPSRRQVLPAAGRSRAAGQARPRPGQARAPGGVDGNPSPTAARPASSATCIRRSPATSSRPWRAPSRDIRSSRACSPKSRRHRRLRDADFYARARSIAARDRGPRGAPDADDRRGDRARAGGGAAIPAGPVLSAAELRDAGDAAPKARGW